MGDDVLSHVIYEALEQIAPGTDAQKLANRVQRLRVGLPAEDEFSIILSWLGRCRLVHKLDQLQSPRESRRELRVPDLLAVFNYKGRDVPVLIEVKTSIDKTLSWQPDFRDALQRYADTLRLPLLIAWRHHTFWCLFEARRLTKAVKNFNIRFGEAMKNTLMSELAGDFTFSLRPGCGIHLKIRKLSEETEGGFDGRIEEAYWTNGEGNRFKKAAGVYPLFLCLEQHAVLVDQGEFVTQSFVIPDRPTSEFAHRALVTLLRFSARSDEVHWRRTLEEDSLPPLARDGLRQAARQALDAGFLHFGADIAPANMPRFLAPPVTA
jgi:Holliday junction resolvase